MNAWIDVLLLILPFKSLNANVSYSVLLSSSKPSSCWLHLVGLKGERFFVIIKQLCWISAIWRLVTQSPRGRKSALAKWSTFSQPGIRPQPPPLHVFVHIIHIKMNVYIPLPRRCHWKVVCVSTPEGSQVVRLSSSSEVLKTLVWSRSSSLQIRLLPEVENSEDFTSILSSWLEIWKHPGPLAEGILLLDQWICNYTSYCRWESNVLSGWLGLSMAALAHSSGWSLVSLKVNCIRACAWNKPGKVKMEALKGRWSTGTSPHWKGHSTFLCVSSQCVQLDWRQILDTVDVLLLFTPDVLHFLL